MNETSLSLLCQLKQAPDPQTWQRLLELYAPLLRRWLTQYEVQPNDIDDLVQEVLMTVSSELPSFDHNGRPGAFRSWLRTTLVHRLRNHWRARGRRPQAGGSDIDRRLAELDDPGTALTQIWNRQHDRHVLSKLLEKIEPDFSKNTWKAFSLTALEGEKPNEVAEQLEISVNAVFIAKSRVLSRLRQEADGLVESSSDFSASS